MSLAMGQFFSYFSKAPGGNLRQFFQLEAEGAAVRSRAKYNLNGEKPSRMFCALEKYNGTQKFIPQLVVKENGVFKTLTIPYLTLL